MVGRVCYRGAKLPGKGLYASETPSGIASHEARIIATKERAEMKMVEFFIPRKLSLRAQLIQSHCAARRKACRAVDEGIVDETNGSLINPKAVHPNGKQQP